MSKESRLTLFHTMLYSHYTISSQWWWLFVENLIGASALLTLPQAVVESFALTAAITASIMFPRKL